MFKRSMKKHKHDFQLLHYASKPGYIGSIADMIVLIICRDCEKVFEKRVENYEKMIKEL